MMELNNRNLLALGVMGMLLAPTGTLADVISKATGEDSLKVLVSEDDWQPDDFKLGTMIPAVHVAGADIVLDGVENEAAWAAAQQVTVPLSYGTAKELYIKALYTDTDVMIRVRWPDATENREHHPWVWNPVVGNYEIGPQVEDSLMFSFEAGCEWFPSFLAGYEFDFDAWHWMAGRTDPIGHALDLAGSMKGFKLGNLPGYESRNTEAEWNLKISDVNDGVIDESLFHRGWDELDRKYEIWPAIGQVFYMARTDGGNPAQDFAEVLAPPQRLPASAAQVAPQYRLVDLPANANDVEAKGRWENGYWTVELKRSLLTDAGLSWDVQFERLTQFSLHVFDATERLDQSSESPRLFLKFLDDQEPLMANQ